MQVGVNRLFKSSNRWQDETSIEIGSMSVSNWSGMKIEDEQWTDEQTSKSVKLLQWNVEINH